ncbi:MAG: amidohydrolase/deacetylase family metallohydrolase [Abditibacteriales bacterium]|nr:amidohydrolase/deacetylase family metallohydrolase [Abditibacteriales bacterium]MDW8364715.1 amidohydrolase/deacetylase family metallohydrolase [Abditibacteriales bacterium]
MTTPERPYDLLLKGGHVIDAANGVDGVRDVAIKGNKIAAVAADIPTALARKTIHVAGYYVTPGLIDIHAHVFGGFAGWLFPDQHCFPNGVTTVVDTGSAGWKNFEEFKETIIARSQTRVLAFLNIVGAGMGGAVEQDVSEMEPEPCAKMIEKYPEYLVGSKTAHFRGHGWTAVDGAVQAARRSGTIAMIDFYPQPERSYQDLILQKLSPGDIHTHLYASHIPLLNAQGEVNAYMHEARQRGIIFDLGHGAGSFWFRIAAPAMQQGFPPDTISTDLHKNSALLPNATMTVTMSKMLNLGMSLSEVVMRSTFIPAQVIRRPELGTLSVGACADVAVLELLEGEFGFLDAGLARMDGDRKLQCVLTMRSGEIVWDLNGISRPAWQAAGQYQRIGQYD